MTYYAEALSNLDAYQLRKFYEDLCQVGGDPFTIGLELRWLAQEYNLPVAAVVQAYRTLDPFGFKKAS